MVDLDPVRGAEASKPRRETCIAGHSRAAQAESSGTHGMRMSCFARAAPSSTKSAELRSMRRTHVQWRPTGQRCQRHLPILTAFSEPPGIQIVV